MGSTSAKSILAVLAKKRKKMVSTEDQDVNINIDQDNEIDADADLAGQIEQTDKNLNPEAGQLNATSDDEDEPLDDAAQAQQIDEMASAVQGLENIKLHIRRLKDSRTPISKATLEALQLAVDNTLMSTPHCGTIKVPSVESVAIDTRGELLALENRIVVSQEGLLDSIGNAWSNMFVAMYDAGKVKGLKSVYQYLDQYDAEAENYVNILVQGSVLSDSWSGADMRGVASYKLSDTVGKLTAMNADLVTTMKNRIPNIETEVDNAIGRIMAGEGLDFVSDNFQQAVSNILLPDGGKFDLSGATIWQSIRAVFGKAYKTSGWGREDDYSKQSSAPLLVLDTKSIHAVTKSLREALNALIPYYSNEKLRRKQVAAMIVGKLSDAVAKANTDPSVDKAIKRNLEEAKIYLGYINGIESAVLGAIFYNIWAEVCYISESLGMLEFIKDPAKAKAEIERKHREEMERLRDELEIERQRNRQRP